MGSVRLFNGIAQSGYTRVGQLLPSFRFNSLNCSLSEPSYRTTVSPTDTVVHSTSCHVHLLGANGRVSTQSMAWFRPQTSFVPRLVSSPPRARLVRGWGLGTRLGSGDETIPRPVSFFWFGRIEGLWVAWYHTKGAWQEK